MSTLDIDMYRRIVVLERDLRLTRARLADAMLSGVPVGVYVLVKNTDSDPLNYTAAGPSGPTGYHYCQRTS